VALFYADASALVKLVLDEPESSVLRTYLDGADVISCELVLSEIPRAIRRAAATDPALPRERLLARAGELLDAIGLLSLDRELLIAAGTLAEPTLRALDAIHVAAAISAGALDVFVTYDERQGAAARLAGLRTIAPAG
jgi:predicted nucleic acid-binding protein